MAGGIFVIAEHRAEKIRPESFELAAFGLELAQLSGEKIIGVILGFPGQPLALQFAKESGLKVIGLENQNFAVYNAEAYVNALFKFISGRKPRYVLISHTATGFDFAPRLAVALGASCLTGLTGIKGKDQIKFVRQICGGKVLTENESMPDTTSVITVMPGTAKAIEPKEQGSVEVLPIDMARLFTRTIGYVEAKRGALDLSKAHVIVSAGRGIRGPENLDLIKKLAQCFDKGAVGASRPVVDAGWLSYEHQVGLTGQTVKPKLYIAIGISGAIQHITGMKNSDLIIAINSDPKANIFKFAHIGIVQDLHKFLPILIERIRRSV